MPLFGAGASAQGQALSNLVATVAPTTGNDNTQGYAAGSVWLNTTTGVLWLCVSAATGAAVWAALNPRQAQSPTNGLPSYQAFTTPGANTYTLPVNATWIRLVGIAGGGGGASGYCGASTGIYCGGSGGGGGGYVDVTIPVSSLTATSFTFTVPSGGPGGAAQTIAGTNGNNGSNGGAISINGNGLVAFAQFGFGGVGGQLGVASAGGQQGGGLGSTVGLPGGGSSATGGAGSNSSTSGTSSAPYGAGGGGGGGGVNNGTFAAGGSSGKQAGDYTAGSAGAGGSTNGAAGGSASTSLNSNVVAGGAGGGGGAGGAGVAGGAGANGQNYGGGGGGGGGTSGGVSSGAGGNGAQGAIAIMAW